MSEVGCGVMEFARGVGGKRGCPECMVVDIIVGVKMRGDPEGGRQNTCGKRHCRLGGVAQHMHGG